jgi:hypothetical protein
VVDAEGVDQLPDDFAIELGRIVYLGGRVEYLLGQLVPAADGQPAGRGLSGDRLVAKLRPIAPVGSDLERILNGYAEQQVWRNHLVHGAHNYANGVIWTWRVPVAGKGNAVFSFQFTIEQLRRLTESWQNLADGAHEELHQRPPSSP